VWVKGVGESEGQGKGRGAAIFIAFYKEDRRGRGKTERGQGREGIEEMGKGNIRQ
jgi:hypothetical protein